MTTIAYRDGVLAADSLVCVSGWKQPHRAAKLHRMQDGTVCGMTGDLAPASSFIRWLDTGEGDKPPMTDARVIHMQHGGRLRVYEDGGYFDLDCEFTAFGSGSPAAQAAMHMGADAARAVEIAALLDDSTGGEIVSMKCEAK